MSENASFGKPVLLASQKRSLTQFLQAEGSDPWSSFALHAAAFGGTVRATFATTKTACRTKWLRLPDGSPDRRVQVSLMNARLLRLIAVQNERLCLAGDNLVVDLDLSEANLRAGQKLAVGQALIEITDVAHNGCRKFAARYGKDASNFINAIERRRLHLRGLYARVVRGGIVRVGDGVSKEI